MLKSGVDPKRTANGWLIKRRNKQIQCRNSLPIYFAFTVYSLHIYLERPLHSVSFQIPYSPISSILLSFCSFLFPTFYYCPLTYLLINICHFYTLLTLSIHSHFIFTILLNKCFSNINSDKN